MASYTALLKLTQPDLGATGWGTTVNSGVTALVEQAVAGAVSVAVTTAGPNTLSAITSGASSDARNQFIILTGTLSGPATLTVPAAPGATSSKLYFIKNSAGDAVTVETSGGTGVDIPNGASMVLKVTTAGVEEAVTYSNAINPAGEIKMWPTGTPPAGYLLCDGSPVSRSTYAALFAVIGTTFGVGDGSTTFNLPNYNNRMPIGAGGLYALGDTGGSKDAVVVSHDHTVNITSGNQSADHTHTGTTSDPGSFLTGSVSTDLGGPSGAFVSPSGVFNVANPTNNYVDFGGVTGTLYRDLTFSGGSHTHTFTTGTQSASHTHTVSGTTASSGSSGTDANLPPYLAINFIIKT